jgi:hypothetical protein
MGERIRLRRLRLQRFARLGLDDGGHAPSYFRLSR